MAAEGTEAVTDHYAVEAVMVCMCVFFYLRFEQLSIFFVFFLPFWCRALSTSECVSC